VRIIFGGAPYACGPSRFHTASILDARTFRARPPAHNLIRVAVTRDISQAVPIAGSFVGGPDDCLGMTVDVAVILGQGAAVRSA
jgi:hypothetical protein